MGASGKRWAHEYWYLHDDQAPDFMTFGGKAGLSGFYSTVAHRLNEEATSFQQQVDMVKLLSYGSMWNIIERKNLLALQKDTSSYFKIELQRIQNTTGAISNIRGYGTHLAFDCNVDTDKLHRWLLVSGVNIHRCAPNTFALRPSLTLGCNDAAQLREALIHYSPNFSG